MAFQYFNFSLLEMYQRWVQRVPDLQTLEFCLKEPDLGLKFLQDSDSATTLLSQDLSLASKFPFLPQRTDDLKGPFTSACLGTRTQALVI